MEPVIVAGSLRNFMDAPLITGILIPPARARQSLFDLR
jgi:hypothetical protein